MTTLCLYNILLTRYLYLCSPLYYQYHHPICRNRIREEHPCDAGRSTSLVPLVPFIYQSHLDAPLAEIMKPDSCRSRICVSVSAQLPWPDGRHARYAFQTRISFDPEQTSTGGPEPRQSVAHATLHIALCMRFKCHD